MSHKLKVLTAAVSAICLASSGAYAIEPETIKAGNFDIKPTIEVKESYNDNIFLSSSDAVDSYIFRVIPEVEATLQNNADVYTLEAKIDNGEYSATKEDDYTDWRVGGLAHIELNERNVFDFDASFNSTHEARGSGFSEGGNLPGSPDKYEDTDYGAKYQFGTTSSFGRVAVNASHYEKIYTNNRDVTANRDRESDRFGGIFYMNLSSDTSLLAEYQHIDLVYLRDIGGASLISNLNSTESYGYVGAEWEATAKTTGIIKVGYSKKDFSDPLVEDLDTPSYDVTLKWEPNTYSSINFNAARKFDETVGTGSAIQRKSYGLDWNHEWSDRVSTNLGTTFSNDDYAGNPRSDDLQSYDGEVSYAFRRWLDFSFDVHIADKRSNNSAFNYDQSVVSIGFEASL